MKPPLALLLLGRRALLSPTLMGARLLLALRRGAAIVPLRGSGAVGHGLDVGPLLEGLVEVADVADDVLVPRYGEGDNGLSLSVSAYPLEEGGRGMTERAQNQTYDEAKGEEGPALEDAAGHVAAVVALAGQALVAGEFLFEGLFAAGEEEEHDGGCCCCCCFFLPVCLSVYGF